MVKVNQRSCATGPVFGVQAWWRFNAKVVGARVCEVTGDEAPLPSKITAVCAPAGSKDSRGSGYLSDAMGLGVSNWGVGYARVAGNGERALRACETGSAAAFKTSRTITATLPSC